MNEYKQNNLKYKKFILISLCMLSVYLACYIVTKTNWIDRFIFKAQYTIPRIHFLADNSSNDLGSQLKISINDENGNKYKILPVKNTALILVDVWDRLHSKPLENEIIYKIKDVLNAARNGRMLVIHAPYTNEISSKIKILPDEIPIKHNNIISDDMELHAILQNHNIKNLVYCGFHTDMCIITRAYGIRRMNQLGYNTILVEDCTTISKSYIADIDIDTQTKLFVNYIIRQFNSCSTTSNEFINGFSG